MAKANGRRRRLPVTLTDAEVEALLNRVYSTKSVTGLRNRTILQVMLGVGLRVTEVVELKGHDVDLEKGTIRVNLGKGAKDRVVPIDQQTRGWLTAWMERRSGYVNNGGGPLFFGLRTNCKPLGVRFVARVNPEELRRKVQALDEKPQQPEVDREMLALAEKLRALPEESRKALKDLLEGL